MTTLKFELAPDVLQFEYGADYPAGERFKKFQTFDRSAGGQPHVESLGVGFHQRVFNFNLMSKTDRDAVIDWFWNIVNAGEKEFTCIDEYGIERTAFFVDNELYPQETSFENFSMTFTLEFTD